MMISRVWSLSAWAEKCGSFPTYVQRCPDLAIGYQDYSLAMAFVGPARARSPALYQKGTRETRL